MVERTDLFRLPFYKKESFTGSDRGIRFFIGKSEVSSGEEEGEKEMALHVIVWPEPFALEHTDEGKKVTKDFPFSEEGLDQAYEWIMGAGRKAVIEGLQEKGA